MKNLFKTCFIVFLALFLTTACEVKESTVEPELNLEFYNNLATTLEKDFEIFSASIRSQNAMDALTAGKVQFGRETPEFDAFVKGYSQNIILNGRANNDIQLNPVQKEEIELILSSIEDHTSLTEFNEYLDLKFNSLSASELFEDDKKFLLMYVTLYKTSLNFLYNNQDLFVQNFSNGKAPVNSWWNSWGKCAAGIAGGAITGATTLGLAGAVAGTALPGVGTVTAGTIGAIGGAIGGALTGAAAAC